MLQQGQSLFHNLELGAQSEFSNDPKTQQIGLGQNQINPIEISKLGAMSGFEKSEKDHNGSIGNYFESDDEFYNKQNGEYQQIEVDRIPEFTLTLDLKDP